MINILGLLLKGMGRICAAAILLVVGVMQLSLAASEPSAVLEATFSDACVLELEFSKPHSIQSDVEGIPGDSLLFIVTADANGFMCPFLTPIYLDKLRKAGASTAEITSDRKIAVLFLSESGLDPSRLLDIAVETGYERDKIHVKPAELE